LLSSGTTLIICCKYSDTCQNYFFKRLGHKNQIMPNVNFCT